MVFFFTPSPALQKALSAFFADAPPWKNALFNTHCKAGFLLDS